jgi:hypothetical protein
MGGEIQSRNNNKAYKVFIRGDFKDEHWAKPDRSARLELH